MKGAGLRTCPFFLPVLSVQYLLDHGVGETARFPPNRPRLRSGPCLRRRPPRSARSRRAGGVLFSHVREHQNRRLHQRRRIRQALSGDIRRGAVHRFEHRAWSRPGSRPERFRVRPPDPPSDPKRCRHRDSAAPARRTSPAASPAACRRCRRSVRAYSISGNCAATSRQQRRNRPSLIFMMLALWIAVTLRRSSRRAYSNAACAIRMEAVLVITFRLSTTSVTTSCSMPEYRSSVFSRKITRSIGRS